MAKFYIGTAGWSYKDWVPSFYPKQQSAKFDWLQYYSRYFNCVEVNATYYAYLNPKIVEGWINKVEGHEDFVFTIKLHQDFTHKKFFNQENINATLFNLDIIKNSNRLGGLLIQFPISFALEQPNVEHINRLKDIFADYKCFIELRHSSWNNHEIINSFNNNNLTFACIDQPIIGKCLPFTPLGNSKSAYFRLHGRNYKNWFTNINNKNQTYDQQNERYKYLYTPAELVEIKNKVKSVEEIAQEIYVIANNHPTGYAVANAFELIHLLEEKSNIDIPSTTLEQFTRLREIAI